MTATTVQLNEGQQLAHDLLVAYITGNWAPVKSPAIVDTSVYSAYAMWLLSGYAGTGKTTTLTKVVASIRQHANDNPFGPRYKMVMSAPTHKAVKVMKRFAKGLPGMDFATIHSLLGLKEQIDNVTGKQKFVQSKDPDQIKIETFDVVFIDESSMLADELFDLLIPYVKRGVKLIFIGDRCQIPPVNHTDSRPFIEAQREKYNIGMVELTSIVRQALDNPILAYATRIRKGYLTTADFEVVTHTIPDKEPLAGIIHVDETDHARIADIVEAYFNCENFKQDADFMKVIAWRNKTVDEFNRMIRQHIYGHKFPAPATLPFVIEGEKMIIDQPVVLPSGRILLSNNEEIEVDHFTIDDGELTYFTMEQVNREWVPDQPTMEIKFYNTWVKYFDEEGIEQQANIRILHESQHAKLKKVLDDIKRAATNVAFNSPFRGKLWKSFYEVDRKFAAVKYNYAITGHKSQGSTYDNCMLVDWDISVNRKTEERNRIRYVAATRARHLLFIVK